MNLYIVCIFTYQHKKWLNGAVFEGRLPEKQKNRPLTANRKEALKTKGAPAGRKSRGGDTEEWLPRQ